MSTFITTLTISDTHDINYAIGYNVELLFVPCRFSMHSTFKLNGPILVLLGNADFWGMFLLILMSLPFSHF